MLDLGLEEIKHLPLSRLLSLRLFIEK